MTEKTTEVNLKALEKQCGIIAVSKEATPRFRKALVEKVLGPLQGVFARDRAEPAEEGDGE